MFALYAVVLFAATHWPALRIEGTGRPDIVVHIIAFFLWTSGLIVCGFFGAPLSVRNVLVSGAVAVVYAAFDEATQAIPWIQRTAAWDDYLADVGGVLLAVAVGMLISRITVGRRAGTPLRSRSS